MGLIEIKDRYTSWECFCLVCQKHSTIFYWSVEWPHKTVVIDTHMYEQIHNIIQLVKCEWTIKRLSNGTLNQIPLEQIIVLNSFALNN